MDELDSSKSFGPADWLENEISKQWDKSLMRDKNASQDISIAAYAARAVVVEEEESSDGPHSDDSVNTENYKEFGLNLLELESYRSKYGVSLVRANVPLAVGLNWNDSRIYY
jgi:hypothetical protein